MSLGAVAGASPMGDEDLERLAGHLALFTQLEVLDLRGNHFTAQGVAALPPLPKLTVIRLAGIDRITGTLTLLTHYPRFPALTNLELEATAVTASGVEKIRRLLPACKVSR